MQNALIVMQIISALLASAERATALVRKAQAEGRDVTLEEISDLQEKDDAARIELEEAILKAQAEGEAPA